MIVRRLAPMIRQAVAWLFAGWAVLLTWYFLYLEGLIAWFPGAQVQHHPGAYLTILSSGGGEFRVWWGNIPWLDLGWAALAIALYALAGRLLIDCFRHHLPFGPRFCLSVVLGAGIAATWTVIMPKGRMAGAEITIMTGAFLCWLILLSYRFGEKKNTSAWMQFLSKYGMLPGILVAAIIGPIIGEIPFPKVQMGFIDLSLVPKLMEHTVFGVGFPSMKFFVEALPLVFAAYIIAFGDFVLAEVVTKAADEVRQDEVIEFNPNRSNIISGFRNLIMGLVAPYGPLCGPLWAGGTIAIAERYKHGRSAMDSIYGGAGSFIIAMFISSLFLPVISLLRPVLPTALSLTLLVQGYACCYIAMDMCKTNQERGVAGIMGIFLAAQTAAWGLGIGILMHLVIGNSRQEAVAAIEKALPNVNPPKGGLTS